MSIEQTTRRSDLNFAGVNIDDGRDTGNDSASPVMIVLAAGAAVIVVISVFAVIGGVVAAVLAVISLIMFFVHLRHRASRRIALLALVLSLAAAAVAGFGVLAQVTNVINECAGLVKGSPEHLSCYQDNYSPFRGLAQALIG